MNEKPISLFIPNRRGIKCDSSDDMFTKIQSEINPLLVSSIIVDAKSQELSHA